MKYEVYTLKEPGSRAQGALRWKDGQLPLNTILFFPRAEPGTVIHMRGMGVPLKVYFLDQAFRLVSYKTMMPGEMFMLPEGAYHVAEASIQATPPQDFAFLQAYL